jgi:hypothetical protein
VKVQVLGLHLALQNDPALAGVKAEPATRRDSALVFNPDGGFDDIAHAIAELKVCLCRRDQH